MCDSVSQLFDGCRLIRFSRLQRDGKMAITKVVATTGGEWSVDGTGNFLKQLTGSFNLPLAIVTHAQVEVELISMFRFRNDTDAPVIIRNTYDGNSTITVKFYGNNGGRTCESERDGSRPHDPGSAAVARPRRRCGKLRPS